MAPPILHLRDIALTFGGAPLLVGAELSVSDHDRICLVGRNGSGKSTLLKIAAGLLDPDSGERFIQPGKTIRYLSQEPDFSGHATLAAYVTKDLTEGDDPYRAQRLMDVLELVQEADPTTLSGGEARRAGLANILVSEPDILLLDEPTNHLDLVAITWLEKELRDLRSAIVIISHDRRLLSTLSNVTVWLDRGQTRRNQQGFEQFETWRDALYAKEESDRHKLVRKIVMEEDWLRYGVTARRKRNQGRLRALQGLRLERREGNRPIGDVTLTAAQGKTSGKLVFDVRGVSKSYDGGAPVIKNLNLRVARRDKLAIIGPNGCGKTTLLNLLLGTLQADTGQIERGTNLDVVRLEQNRDSLVGDVCLADVLTGGKSDMVSVGGSPRHVMSYMKDFLFLPEQARTPVSRLSGGERGRLVLARELARPSNLLVLDEPTNDLDLETLDLLQEMLSDYQGTVLLVSHDRDFIDRIATSVLTCEGNGEWVEYAGGYSDMLAQGGGAFAGAEPVANIQARSPDKSVQKSQASKKKQKLSFKEQYALENLPREIDLITGEIAALERQLSDNTLYARDPDGFQSATANLTNLQNKLQTMEDEWLRLEILRESLTAG